jgi:hypothetical protein
MSSLSISSRVSRVSSSTSAGVRLAVGIGAKTVCRRWISIFSSYSSFINEGNTGNAPLMGILPELKTRLLT